jgi:hypothetical protein
MKRTSTLPFTSTTKSMIKSRERKKRKLRKRIDRGHGQEIRTRKVSNDQNSQNTLVE